MRAAKLAAAAKSLKRAPGVRDAAFCLAFLTDRARVPDPESIARALPPGAAVILRDYDAPRRADLAKKLKSICAGGGVLFLVGADAALARAIGADGVHFPSWQNADIDMPGMIKTAACHSGADLQKAAEAGADLAFLSPVFPTASHKGERTLGVAAFRSLARSAPLPVLALGGVDEANALRLAGPNLAGFGAIGAFAPR